MSEYQQLDSLIKEFATVFPGSMSNSLAIAKAKAELKKRQAEQTTLTKQSEKQSKKQMEDWEVFLSELESGVNERARSQAKYAELAFPEQV